MVILYGEWDSEGMEILGVYTSEDLAREAMAAFDNEVPLFDRLRTMDLIPDVPAVWV